MFNKIVPISIALLALLSAFFWNELNIKNLKVAGIPLRENQTVITEDDASYLNPYQRLYKNGRKNETEYEKFSSSIRPPGYGLLYYFSLKLGGKSNGLFVLKSVQCVLFAFSVFCLFEIALFFTKSNWLSAITALIYGLLPFSMGFLYYTLTEGITPALLLISIYFLLKLNAENEVRYQLLYLFLAGSVVAVLLVVRPFLIFFLPFFALGLLITWFRQKGLVTTVLNTLLFLSISLSGLVSWQIKSKIELGKWIGLHPIYQNEIPGVFRKPHESLWNMFKGWESNGAHFHETVVPFWEATMALDTSQKQIDKVVAQIPKNVVKSLGEKELIWAFELYRKAILVQKPYFDARKKMPSFLFKEEVRAQKNFERLALKFRSKNKIEYHLRTPFKVSKSLVFHSNLSLHQFQHAYRGTIWMELLRYVCFFIHSLAFILLPFVFFVGKNYQVRLLVLGVLFYCFYLIYFQRGIEERYTLPVLPLVLLFGVIIVDCLIKRLRKVKKKNVSFFRK